MKVYFFNKFTTRAQISALQEVRSSSMGRERILPRARFPFFGSSRRGNSLRSRSRFSFQCITAILIRILYDLGKNKCFGAQVFRKELKDSMSEVARAWT